MRYALLGALPTVGGIAALVISASHHPHFIAGGIGHDTLGGTYQFAGTQTGWPETTFDLVRIGGWALLVFGVVIVLFSLVREISGANEANR